MAQSGFPTFHSKASNWAEPSFLRAGFHFWKLCRLGNAEQTFFQGFYFSVALSELLVKLVVLLAQLNVRTDFLIVVFAFRFVDLQLLLQSSNLLAFRFDEESLSRF